MVLFSDRFTPVVRSLNSSEGAGTSEPEIVNHLRSPGIDSQPAGAYTTTLLTYRPARLHRLAKIVSLESITELPLNVYKFGSKVK
jgi:hypothetical protein